MAGVCLGNVHWKNSNPSLAQLLESMLLSSGYRLRFLSVAPDFIFNSMGLSVAFVLMTEWNSDTIAGTLERIGKIRKIFRNCYIIFTVTSNEANHCFLDGYFRSKLVEIATPPFIPVTDGPMALERMLNLADVHAGTWGMFWLWDAVHIFMMHLSRQNGYMAGQVVEKGISCKVVCWMVTSVPNNVIV